MIICADDYGLRDDIDAAILDLCHSGKVSAVSCMAALDRCDPKALQKLLPYKAALDIGLHLCFTGESATCSSSAIGTTEGAPSFSMLLRRALTGRIDVAEFQHQISLQYQLFVQKTGHSPDHIDGHLHAHQLPGIREALIHFVLTLPEGRRPYIRNTAMPSRHLWRHRLPWAKALLIGTFGAALQKRLRDAGLRTNRGFAGIYDFKNWARYPQYLPKFAQSLTGLPDAILVVHPGSAEDWRSQEYRTLSNFVFPAGSPNRFGLQSHPETVPTLGGRPPAQSRR